MGSLAVGCLSLTTLLPPAGQLCLTYAEAFLCSYGSVASLPVKLKGPCHTLQFRLKPFFPGQIRGRADGVHAEQDPGQVLQGTSGNSETLAASGVLSPETSSADSQVSPPSARKFRPALEFVPEGGGFVRVCEI